MAEEEVKKEVKVVYDWSQKTEVEEGDTGSITTTKESTRGEWPACLAERDSFLSPPSLFGGVLGCSCGKHTVYMVVTPEEAWPNDGLKLIRVVEKQ